MPSKSFATMPEEATNFQRAIYQMIRDPEFCTIAMYMMEMEIIPDDGVGTAATDCVRRIWYSPKYFAESGLEECKSALIHEVYHKFLNFFPRFERWVKRHAMSGMSRGELLRIFNKAQDYFINWIIKHQWNMFIRPTWIYDARYSPATHTTESIADDLVRNPPPEPPPPPPPQPPEDGEGEGSPDDESTGEDDDEDEAPDGDCAGDDGEDEDEGDGEAGGEGEAQAGEGDDIRLPEEYDGDIENIPTEQELMEMEAANKASAANADRMAKPMRGVGKGDGSSDPFSEKIDGMNYQGRHNWGAQINKYAKTNARSGSYTYSRPNSKRRTAQGVLYPGPVGKELGDIIFAVDSSGSTSGGMVNYFFKELEHALKTAMFKRAIVIWCSDGIPRDGVFEYTKADIGKLDKRIRRCGGGTEFLPVFERVKKDYPNADCLTYLTDGGVGDYDIEECFEYWSKNMRNVPVVWALADLGWSCCERFTEHCNRIGFGVVAELPMDQLDE